MTPNEKTATATATESTPKLQTKHVAKMFNMRQQQLRRILRSMAEYADGVHTNYAWDPADKAALQRIKAAIDAKAAKAEAAKKAAQEKIAKAAAEAKAQEKVEKKVA